MRKIFPAFLLLPLVLFSACAEENNDTVITESVTVSITGETVTTAAETEKKGFGDYTVTTAASTYAETERTKPQVPYEWDWRLAHIGSETYHYYHESKLELDDFDDDIDECLGDIIALAPKIVAVNSMDPSAYECNAIMRALPFASVGYSPSVHLPEEEHSEGFQFYVNPVVEIYDKGYERWENYQRYIFANFSNFSDEPMTVDTLRIYNETETGWEPVPFKDGGFELAVNFPVEANHEAAFNVIDKYDFAVTEEYFDYGSAKSGRYKAVFTSGETEREMVFYIDRFGGREYPKGVIPEFLTEEQTAALTRAHDEVFAFFREPHITKEYAETHSFEDFHKEFLPDLTCDLAFRLTKNSGGADDEGNLLEIWSDYPGNVCYAGNILLPIYSDENTVVLKETLVLYHWDYPYSISYEEKNIRLIKTENGWLADEFPDIYY